MLVGIHLIAALWVLAAGAAQLAGAKGTPRHRALGWSWMLAMTVVALSSFGMPSFMPVLGPYGPIHLLSVWVLICVAVGVLAARQGRIGVHRAFTAGAFLGAVGAGIGALAPDRLLHKVLFGV